MAKSQLLTILSLATLAGVALSTVYFKKTRNNVIKDNYIKDFIKENSDNNKKSYYDGEEEFIGKKSYFWSVKIPVPVNEENMRSLKKVLASMRHNYWDCIIIDLIDPVFKKDRGMITFIQLTRREKAYQIELHINTFYGEDKQYVTFIPELGEVMMIIRNLLVNRKAPDLEKWFDCTDLIFKEEFDNLWDDEDFDDE